MSVLLIAEHNNKELKPFTLNVINAAKQIDEETHVLLIGYNADPVSYTHLTLPTILRV